MILLAIAIAVCCASSVGIGLNSEEEESEEEEEEEEEEEMIELGLEFCLFPEIPPSSWSGFGLGLTGLSLSKPNRLSLNGLGVFKLEPNWFINRLRL